MNRYKAALLLCFFWLALLWPADRLLAYRDLETGTFLTRDPAGMVDGPNVYSYVRQNPWTKFDPEGLWEELGDQPGQFKVVRGSDGSIGVGGSMIVQTGPGLLNAYNAVPNPAEVAAYNFYRTGNYRYLDNNPAIKAGGLGLATRGMNDPRGESERLAGIVGIILSFGAGPSMAEAVMSAGPTGPAGQSARMARGAATASANSESVEEAGLDLYRGVDVIHPDLPNAKEGRANPRGGHENPGAHNMGNTDSVFTSWTTERYVADEAANANGPGGVTLHQRVKLSELISSPDSHGEAEVLRRGPITGATPLQPLPENRPSWFDSLEKKKQ